MKHILLVGLTLAVPLPLGQPIPSGLSSAPASAQPLTFDQSAYSMQHENPAASEHYSKPKGFFSSIFGGVEHFFSSVTDDIRSAFSSNKKKWDGADNPAHYGNNYMNEAGKYPPYGAYVNQPAKTNQAYPQPAYPTAPTQQQYQRPQHQYQQPQYPTVPPTYSAQYQRPGTAQPVTQSSAQVLTHSNQVQHLNYQPKVVSGMTIAQQQANYLNYQTKAASGMTAAQSQFSNPLQHSV